MRLSRNHEITLGLAVADTEGVTVDILKDTAVLERVSEYLDAVTFADREIVFSERILSRVIDIVASRASGSPSVAGDASGGLAAAALRPVHKYKDLPVGVFRDELMEDIGELLLDTSNLNRVVDVIRAKVGRVARSVGKEGGCKVQRRDDSIWFGGVRSCAYDLPVCFPHTHTHTRTVHLAPALSSMMR